MPPWPWVRPGRCGTRIPPVLMHCYCRNPLLMMYFDTLSFCCYFRPTTSFGARTLISIFNHLDLGFLDSRLSINLAFFKLSMPRPPGAQRTFTSTILPSQSCCACCPTPAQTNACPTPQGTKLGAGGLALRGDRRLASSTLVAPPRFVRRRDTWILPWDQRQLLNGKRPNGGHFW